MRKWFILLISILSIPMLSATAQESGTTQLRIANFTDAEVQIDVNEGEHTLTVMPGEITAYLEATNAELGVVYQHPDGVGFTGMTLTAGSQVALVFFTGISFGEPGVDHAFISETAPPFAANLAALTFIDGHEIAEGQPDFSWLALTSGENTIALRTESTDSFGEPTTVFVQPEQYTLAVYEGLSETPFAENLAVDLSVGNGVVIVTGGGDIPPSVTLYSLPR